MDNLTQFETTIIKLAKTYYIPPLTWEDTAQELRIHLWLNNDKFNPKLAGYKTWATKICKHKIRDLAKYYTRQKRDERKIVSLDKILEEQGDIFEG